jgi:hypothetical protein
LFFFRFIIPCILPARMSGVQTRAMHACAASTTSAARTTSTTRAQRKRPLSLHLYAGESHDAAFFEKTFAEMVPRGAGARALCALLCDQLGCAPRSRCKAAIFDGIAAYLIRRIDDSDVSEAVHLALDELRQETHDIGSATFLALCERLGRDEAARQTLFGTPGVPFNTLVTYTETGRASSGEGGADDAARTVIAVGATRKYTDLVLHNEGGLDLDAMGKDIQALHEAHLEELCMAVIGNIVGGDRAVYGGSTDVLKTEIRRRYALSCAANMLGEIESVIEYFSDAHGIDFSEQICDPIRYLEERLDEAVRACQRHAQKSDEDDVSSDSSGY